jgi:hypothetical protein
MSETMSVPAVFINLDLELESSSDLAPLVKELGHQVFVLFCGQVSEGFRLTVEPLIDGSFNTSASACTEHFLALLEGLSPDGAAILRGCAVRVFDYGFDGGLDANPIHTDLCTSYLARMVALGIDIRITTYPYRAAVPE